MKTRKVEKVITTLKDRIGHPLKEAPYRNLNMNQQLNFIISSQTDHMGDVTKKYCLLLQLYERYLYKVEKT